MSIAFTVPGVAAPGGSKRAFAHPKTGRIIVTDDAKNNAGWKQRVSIFARQAMEGRPPLEGPLKMSMTFVVARPNSHYRTGKYEGRLKDWATTTCPTSRPDVTKLVRAAEDAMSGIVFKDDAQVVLQLAAKRYGDAAELRIVVDRFED